MKTFRWWLFFFLLSFSILKASVADSSPTQASDSVVPHLFAAVDKIKGGEPFEVYLLFDLEPGWHFYWSYPGDVGLPPRATWELPAGWTVSDLEFSLPEQFSEAGKMIVYGYEKSALLRARITPANNLAEKKSWTIQVHLSWLTCKNLCVPGKSTLVFNVPATVQEQTMARTLAVPSFWPYTQAPPFAVFIRQEGKNYLVSFQAEEGCCYELFPLPPTGSSAGHVMTTVHGRCYEMKVPWEGEGSFHALLTGKDAMGVRRGWWLPASSSKKTIVKTLPSLGNLWTLLVALASGFLGGFILNLMPCVLPVISLKIFGFIKQAGTSRLRVFHHGLAFVAGIYLWFLTLAALVITLKASGMQVTWAFQFQNPAFLLSLSVIIFLFALNLFGVFEMALPGSASSSFDALASRTGYAGSFFQGLFATLLATPCTAPFLGSALGFAFAQSGLVILVMFFAVATGMALPYFILSAQPVWMKWLPRPGAWMEKMKILMGFPLLATNLWLLSVLGAQRGLKALLATLVLLLTLGLSAWIYGAFVHAKKLVQRLALLLSGVIACVSFWYLVPTIITHSPLEKDSSLLSETTSSNTPEQIEWVPYSTALLEKLRQEGKAVFVDFTAAWCLTCQFNERTAIDTKEVRALLRSQDMIAMKADWTNANPEITEALRSFGRVGVPFYVFYPSSKSGQLSKPIIFSELLTEAELIKAFSSR